MYMRTLQGLGEAGLPHDDLTYAGIPPALPIADSGGFRVEGTNIPLYAVGALILFLLLVRK